MIAASGAVLVLAAVLAWAWHDGGMRPEQAMTSPALLPRIAP